MVRIRLEPRPPLAGKASFEVVAVVPEGKLQPEYIRASESGIREASQSGILGGYPVIDWKATVVGGEQHETDSSELAFENAGRVAFYEAMKAASPILLQPIMAVEVVTSDEYFGAIMADLNARKAVVRETQISGQSRMILADVALAKMFGYVTRLRSLSQGRATWTMAPSHYAPVPGEEMKVLVG